MKWGHFVVTAFLAVALVFTSACGGSEDEFPATGDERAASISDAHYAEEEENVRDAFLDYREALLSQDGAEAAQYLSTESLEYYERLGRHALYSNKRELHRLRAVDLLTVVMLRHMVPANRLAKMSGSEIVGFAVDRGIVGDKSVAVQEPGEITVSTDRAVVEVLTSGEPGPSLTFRLEGGTWKLDFTDVLAAADLAFQQLVKKTGLTEDQFILQMAESVSGKSISNKIWNPPKA